MSSNLLNGSIPASLSALTNLQTLALSLNPLSGSIPSSLSALTNLQSLDLAGSQLSGNIPSSLGTLTNLQSLNLGGNGLSGSIPVSLGALTNLQSLDLSNNHLSGSIPASLSAMTNLQTLILNNNQLSGCWPASLSALCGVRFKDFSNNAGLPDGGSSTAFNTFCSTGQGSDAFVASALASSTTATVGDVVSLSTSGGSSYSWTAPTGANLSSPGTTSVVSATINQTGVQTFTVVVNNGGTCSQTATVSVTVSTLAPSIVNFSPDPDPVCPGSQVTFTALIRNVTGSYAYTLTNGTTTISGTSSAPNFSQTITAQSTNTRQAELQSFSLIVSSNGQSAIETYELSVHDLPSLTLTAGNGGVIGCNVTSLTLTAKGGDDYRFNGPGVFSQDSENGFAVINTAGVYSVTVTSANGCTATTSTSVFSNTATVTVSNPVVTTAAVGLGFSQSFTATGGTAPYTYTLISGTLPTGLTFVTTGALSGTPTQSGIFSITVRASDANGCSATGTLYTVAVSTTATVITATPTNVQATSAVLGGSVTADGGASVTERGVIYIVGNGIPTTSDTKVAIGSGVGSFTQSVTGLTSNTAYSVRAYAINAAGPATAMCSCSRHYQAHPLRSLVRPLMVVG
ncbi:leucine-rich repeat domain-containing protein [Spirosoma telluris]|uniref:leucine-rich repeat domain-containing protein n=1 Tax=Spirosoma telluris TaxID=2183553 RepID=UPI002FC3715C